MAPTAEDPVGPHPSFIEVAKPYVLQAAIQRCLDATGMTEEKDSVVRMQGVAWIDNVRRSLQVPVRTFDTAVVYFHKFRLLHADSEYSWGDAAAAALFTACKIEDTLKKSKEILCASFNLNRPSSEHVSADDPRFENGSKVIIGLERLMLESASFDFRNRYPQKVMVKLAKACGLGKENASKTAWNLSIDLYRTFAPLKQTTTTMAIACIELAARLHELDMSRILDTGAMAYKKWNTSRAEVMETLLDLLDLYTHQRGSSAVGPLFTIDTFLAIRIGLNQEATAAKIPRYAVYAHDTESSAQKQTNGVAKLRNGIVPPSPLTPATPGTISPGTAPPSMIGPRGQNGTVRFMLDATRAQNETKQYNRYHKVEEEEYEVEVAIEPERKRRVSVPQSESDPAQSLNRIRGKGKGLEGRGRRTGIDDDGEPKLHVEAGKRCSKPTRGRVRGEHAPVWRPPTRRNSSLEPPPLRTGYRAPDHDLEYIRDAPRRRSSRDAHPPPTLYPSLARGFTPRLPPRRDDYHPQCWEPMPIRDLSPGRTHLRDESSIRSMGGRGQDRRPVSPGPGPRWDGRGDSAIRGQSGRHQI